LKTCVLLPLFIFVYPPRYSSPERVLNPSSGNAIAYANIGIVNTGMGTISNEDGTFSLQVPLKKAMILCFFRY